MASTSPTILRNKEIVGRNSKSYNDKHPENPIPLRPIRDAIKYANTIVIPGCAPSIKLIKSLYRLRNFSRPAIGRGIWKLMPF